MVTLKTDFTDGEVLYAGTTADTDKLNRITNTINDLSARDEFYKHTYTNNVEDSITGVTYYTETAHTFTLTGMLNKTIISIHIKTDLKRGAEKYPYFTLGISGTNTGIYQGREAFIYSNDSPVLTIYGLKKYGSMNTGEFMFANNLTTSYETYSASFINLPIYCLDDDIKIAVYCRGEAPNRVGYINNTTITVVYG